MTPLQAAGALLETRPLNSFIKREFVPLSQVTRLREEEDGWWATLLDGSIVALKDKPGGTS